MEKHRSLKLLSIFLAVFMVITSLSGVVSANELPFDDEESRIPVQDDLELSSDDEISLDAQDDALAADEISEEDGIIEVKMLEDDAALDADELPLDIAQDEIIVEEDTAEAEDLPAEVAAADTGVVFTGTIDGVHLDADDCSLFDSYQGLASNNSGYYRYTLTGIDAAAYNALKSSITDVANGGRTSTVFDISYEELGVGDGSFTASDLGVSSLVVNGGINPDVDDALTNKIMFNLRAVMSRLLVDLPYDLYWYDKVKGVTSSDIGYSIVYSNGEYVLNMSDDGIAYSFSVANDYASGSYKVNPTKINIAKQASANAKAIVEKYSGLSDLEKLNKYREEICNLVSYNDSAANGGVSFGDPWQLVYVFDGNSSTNVVCEGYSKAFKYLCDLSSFSGNVDCLIVYGLFSTDSDAGDDHMWNVVCMGNGKNYLADLTNCDSGTIGYSDQLFMKNATTANSVNKYSFKCSSCTAVYEYDAEIRDTLYRDDYVTITTQAIATSTPATTTPTTTTKPTTSPTTTTKPTTSPTTTTKPTTSPTTKPTTSPTTKPTTSPTTKPTTSPTTTTKPTTSPKPTVSATPTTNPTTSPTTKPTTSPASKPSWGNDDGSGTKPSSNNNSGSNKPSWGNDDSSSLKPSSNNNSGSTKPSWGNDDSSSLKPSSNNNSGSNKPSWGNDDSSSLKPSSNNNSGSTKPSWGNDDSSSLKPSSNNNSGSTKPSWGNDDSSSLKPSSNNNSGSTKPSWGNDDDGSNLKPSSNNNSGSNKPSWRNTDDSSLRPGSSSRWYLSSKRLTSRGIIL